MSHGTIWKDKCAQLQHQQADELLTEIARLESALPPATVLGSVKTQLTKIKAGSRHPTVNRNDAQLSALLAFVLGMIQLLGIIVVLFAPSVRDFGLYLCATAIFHMLEYRYVSTFHPKDLSSDSFCFLTHSRAFTIAMAVCITEYWVEWLIFPSLKANWWLYTPGFIAVMFFQAIRTVAMTTAGRHFHHQVRTKREQGHELVTRGIYQYSRHPSYFGWFWWAVSMPVLLGNPICTVGYCIVSLKFFDARICEEERHLVKFFGKDYEDYRNKVPVGIPFFILDLVKQERYMKGQ